MAIAHITPQNWQQSIINGSVVSLDSRQYLPWHTVSLLANRAKLHRSSATSLARRMRAIADGIGGGKPEALPQQPSVIGLYSQEDLAAERERLRTMADYIDSILDQFLPG